jgi:uncharacterized membrane protein YkoI
MMPISHLFERPRLRQSHRAVTVLLAATAVFAAAAGVAPDAAAAGRGGPVDSAGTAVLLDSSGDLALKSDLSLDEAIDRAQKRYRARVVRAEQVEQGGRVVYVLRLLSDDDGRVFTIRVDARSGDMR